MRMIVPLALAISIAAPAGARRAVTPLPAPPRGVDYVETICTGGIAATYEQVRVLANGQVLKTSRASFNAQHAGASRAELRRIWRQLDLARFETRDAPPEQPYIMDGIDCSLKRVTRGRAHVVMLMQQMRGKPRYRDLSQAIDDINALGRRAAGPIMRPADAP